ncbi:MAG: VTT domain-containing protein [Patescibacteria group bacterium]
MAKTIRAQDIGIIIFTLAAAILFVVWEPTLPSQATVTQWVQRFGAAGPLAVIGLVVVEVVIAPIPGSFIPITVGALFGVWPGVLYTWVGNVIGAVIAFWLARRIGRPLVIHFVKPATLDRLDTFIHRNPRLLWLVYILPVYPIDLITFAVGLSRMSFKRFMVMMTISFSLHQLILTAVGERLLAATGGTRILIASLAVLLVLGTLGVERHFTTKEKTTG